MPEINKLLSRPLIGPILYDITHKNCSIDSTD